MNVQFALRFLSFPSSAMTFNVIHFLIDQNLRRPKFTRSSCYLLIMYFFLSYFFEAAPEVSSMDNLTQEQQEILDKVSWYIYLTIYSCIQQSRYKWSAHLEYLFTV